MKRLFKVSATGSMQEWNISGNLSTGIVTYSYGQLGGEMQTHTESIVVNQSGRSLKEQMILQIKSRISRQKAKGYRDTEKEALAFINRNELNLYKPMLAQSHDKVKNINLDSLLRQRKLDGHRMLVTNNGGQLVAYSRNGKIIDTLSHILDYIDIPEGLTLDGEVYFHGVPLQTVSSWCKRRQPATLKLDYHVYDLVSDEPFVSRLAKLRSLNLGPRVRLVDTWKSSVPIHEDLDRVIGEGYEGLMLRQSNMPYGTGKRCKSLIKVKKLLDDEFVVVDIHESSDGWAILECQIGDKTFRTSAPGNMDEKREVLKNSGNYIGKLVTCEYFSLTKEGLPFHCSARRWREDL